MGRLFSAVIALASFVLILWSLIYCCVIGGLSLSEWWMVGNSPFPLLWFSLAAFSGGLLGAASDE